MHMVTHPFGAHLAERVLSKLIPFLEGPNVGVWCSSCTSKVMGKDLHDLYKEESSRRLDGRWIWRLRVHLKVSLFI